MAQIQLQRTSLTRLAIGEMLLVGREYGLHARLCCDHTSICCPSLLLFVFAVSVFNALYFWVVMKEHRKRG